jgi:hypothetical protein
MDGFKVRSANHTVVEILGIFKVVPDVAISDKKLGPCPRLKKRGIYRWIMNPKLLVFLLPKNSLIH